MMGLWMAEALAMTAGTEFMYGVSMSAYLQAHKEKRRWHHRGARWDSTLVSMVTGKNIYPAKAVRATQEYGDQEMT